MLVKMAHTHLKCKHECHFHLSILMNFLGQASLSGRKKYAMYDHSDLKIKADIVIGFIKLKVFDIDSFLQCVYVQH